MRRCASSRDDNKKSTMNKQAKKARSIVPLPWNHHHIYGRRSIIRAGESIWLFIFPKINEMAESENMITRHDQANRLLTQIAEWLDFILDYQDFKKYCTLYWNHSWFHFRRSISAKAESGADGSILCGPAPYAHRERVSLVEVSSSTYWWRDDKLRNGPRFSLERSDARKAKGESTYRKFISTWLRPPDRAEIAKLCLISLPAGAQERRHQADAAGRVSSSSREVSAKRNTAAITVELTKAMPRRRCLSAG